MDNDINRIAKLFRSNWRGYAPLGYRHHLEMVDEDKRLELLARLFATEIEFAYQPPAEAERFRGDEEADDERIRPSLNILLAQYPQLAERPDLLTGLSVLEYALRLQHDVRPPNPESYLGLCSASQDHLYQLLQRTEDCVQSRSNQVSTANCNDSTVKDTKDSSEVCLDRLPNNLGCFLLINLISRGGMGFVYSAIDLRTAAPVAVKVMRRDDSWSIYRFIEEFSWLSQVNHPNLVKLYDACVEGDQRYFSMELVEGKNVQEWFRKIRREKSTPWLSLKKILAQAASAIQFLHDNSAIHCDIKCSNLMITARRRAVLLDLGLAIRSGSQESGVGTLQYTAPEVIAQRKHSPASDWYSFGLMIYEILADTFELKALPSSGGSGEERGMLDLLDVRSQIAGTDPELIELCCDLLAVDPNDRPKGLDILRRLGSPEHPQISANHFCGREESLQRLTLFHRQAKCANNSQVMIISGESGIGKSILLEQWLKQADLSEELVLEIRCFRQDQTPFRLLNGLLQQLVRVLSSQPAAWWRPLLEPHLESIAETFPQVHQLINDEMDLKSRGLRRKADKTEALGIQHLFQWIVDLTVDRRFIIAIDDVQWADSRSLWHLSSLLKQPQFRGLLIANEEGSGSYLPSAMTGDFENSHQESVPKSDLPGEREIVFSHLELAPLSPAAAEELLLQWVDATNLDGLTPAITENILHRGNGNPFLLRELFLAYTHHARRESFSDAQWLDTDSQSNLRRRFALLPLQAEYILQYLAVAGQPLSFHQLQIVSRILPDDLQRTLNLLASQGWIQSQSRNFMSDVALSHDKFRKAILASIPQDRLHRRHFRMARMLSSEAPPPWARVAEHYWKAEQFREAATCYLQAAHAAIEIGSFQDALHFLSRAAHEDADRKPREIEDVATLEADCLAAVGNSRLAATRFEALYHATSDPNSKLLYRCLAGEQWIRGGQLESGLKYLDDTLRHLGITRLKHSGWSHLALRLKILWNYVTDNQENASSVESEKFDPLERTLSRIGIPLTFLDNQLGPDLILQFKKYAQQRGSVTQQASATVHYALLLSFGKRRWLKPALKWLRLGRELSRKSGNSGAAGNFQLSMFAIRAQQGRMHSAARYAQRGIQYYSTDARSWQWELQFLQWALLGYYWDSMKLRELQDSCLEYRASAAERSDSMSQFFMHVGAAHLADLVVNDVAGARQSLETASHAIANQTFQSPRFFLWLSEVRQKLYEGESSAAQQLLLRDWVELRRAYVLGTNHYRWLALCLRLCCQLATIRDQQNISLSDYRSMKKSISQMQRLEHPPFVAYGKAFDLVFKAFRGRIADRQSWLDTIEELDRYGHHLQANALRWQAGLYLDSDQALVDQARRTFVDQGCVAPEKLMQTLIPLPH